MSSLKYLLKETLKKSTCHDLDLTKELKKQRQKKKYIKKQA